jgi:uncharacterized protein YutD
MKNKNIEINNKTYELIKDEDKCFDLDMVKEKVTDYFDDYDYIFGDFAYGKVRLKGYYDSKNKKAKKINDIKYLEDYIKNYCCYGAKTFLLKKIK